MKNRENRAKQGQGHPQVSAKLARGSVTFFWGGGVVKGNHCEEGFGSHCLLSVFFLQHEFPCSFPEVDYT